MASQGIFQVFAVTDNGVMVTEAGERKAPSIALIIDFHMAPDSQNLHLHITDQRFSIHCPSPFPVGEARMLRQKKWRDRLRNSICRATLRVKTCLRLTLSDIG
jgi:hypothetical protein